jgi:putative membrane-bound dehydrogenase-like protein
MLRPTVVFRAMAPARLIALLVLLGCAPALLADSPVNPGKPLSPEEGLKSIRVKDGLEVELVAAEPLTVDPVAIAWGADGKLWVVEDADYPLGSPSPKASRIRFLEDTDGDGKYDKSTLFMDGIRFPNGILPWRKGIIVTAAPEIFYAEDTNGDGKGDKKELLYTGFTEGNPQLRINGLRWGLDNWVYLANGWSSRGKVKSLKTGQEVEVGGRDLRIRPDTGEIEAVEGMTEFGRERDDWGDWFGCDNAHPMWHFVLPERYTKRNPHVPAPDPREQLLKPFPPRVYAASKPARRYNAFDIQDYFQSACSGMVYRDELLFQREERTRHAFVCDPVHNLVHHSILTESGVTFTAARAPGEQTSEFFASTDNWCRPVMALTGPDGALWVVDMYRFMIEHPEYLPPIGKKELEPHYRLGDDRGRIYRVVPKGQERRAVPRMDRRNTIELCRAAMDSPSGWQRDTAQMLLLWNKERMGHEAKGELSGVVYGSQNPLARLQALCTLEGLEAVTPEVLVAALGDAHPMVRRQALGIVEPIAPEEPKVMEAALKLADDADPRVRLQFAFSVGEWDGPAAGAALAKVASAKDAEDSYLAAAVLSSAGKHFKVLAGTIVGGNGGSHATIDRGLIRMAVAGGDAGSALQILQAVMKPVNGTYTAGQLQTFAQWLDLPSTNEMEFGNRGEVFAAVESLVAKADTPLDTRLAAVALLGRRPGAAAFELRALTKMLSPQSPPELQRAAVAAFGRIGGDRVPPALLEKWAEHSPDLRGAIVDLLLRNEAWTAKLLDAVESQQVTAADIDLPRRQRLMNHASKAIKNRAAKLLAESAVASNRQKVLDAWQPVLSMKGDAKRGAEVFRQSCAVCHKLNDQGQDVGPNLETVREWTGEAMLTSILDPSRQFEPKYVAYTATTNAGEAIYGVITGETGTSVTMKGLDGKDRPVPRTELKSLVSTNRSLMPDGFESSMSRQQLADLMQFLKAPEQAR